MPPFWCTAFSYATNAKKLRIVYEKHLLYQSDRIYQVKFKQLFQITLTILGEQRLVYIQMMSNLVYEL